MRKRYLGLCLSGLLLAMPARAEPTGESADALFVRARTFMKAGDCENALPLLEESHTLEPTVGTRFNMAICEGRLGKLTRAAEHLRSVIGALAPDDARRGHAEKALHGLLPRIPHLVIELDDPHQNVELVRVDGDPLPGLRANEPYAVDPGVHTLEVTLAGRPPQLLRFNVAERQIYAWSLAGLRAERKAEPAPPAAPAPGKSTEPRTPPSSSWTPQRTVAVVAGGTSLLAFGVATGFALSARSVYASSAPYCDADDACDPEGIRRREEARTHGTLATVGVVVGVASALGGATLWLTGGPRASARSVPLHVGAGAVAGGSDGVGVVVSGSY